MSTTVNQADTGKLPATAPGQIWWREPLMWLVVGGPAVVVVAALWTVWIAVTHADPLLDKRAPSQSDSMARQRALQLTDLPAGEARNHVATPQTALPAKH